LNACLSLAAANPESSPWKLELCSGYTRLGSCLLEQSDIPGARKASQSAFQLARELDRLAPADRAVQMQFARTHDNVGDVMLAEKQSSEALVHYKEALRIRLETAQADPDNAEWQRELTRSYLRIGRARAGEDKSSKLTGLFQESLQAMGRVHRKHLQFAQELLSAGRPDARSIEALRENVTRARELADKDPANLEWQDNLARNYSLAGDVLFESGEKAAAFDDYREAVKIRADLAGRAGVAAVSFQVDLATERARFAARLEHSGDHKAALAQARLALDVLRPLLSRWPGSLAFLQMDGPGSGTMLVALNPQQRADFVEAFKRGFTEAQRRAAKDRADWANYCSEMAVLDFLQEDIRNAVTHASAAAAFCRQMQQESLGLPDAQERLSTELLSLGFLELLNHQVPEAMQTAQAILDNRRDSLGANGLLALAHLLRGEVAETQQILLKLKNVQVAPGKSFAEALFADYARLRGKGFPIANPQIVDVVFVRNF
jgi:tetratricopeptide (TPR) repeat protein